MNDQILGLLDGDYTAYLTDDSGETEDDECFERSFNIQTVKTHKMPANKKIIFSEHLKKQINSLNNLNWLRRRLSSAKIEEDCKKLKKSVEANIKLEKSNYYNNLINNSVNRSKMLWQLVNSKRDSGVSNKAILEISYKDTTYTNNIDIANVFGEYFSTFNKTRCPIPFDISFNGNKIESSLSAKFLGIHLDQHLSWEEQLQYKKYKKNTIKKVHNGNTVAISHELYLVSRDRNSRGNDSSP
nr:unnamed protein product [Callosobruchus analis]